MANPLKPYSQRPYDPNLGDTTNQYLDWVTSALNQLIGQANKQPNTGLQSLVNNQINPTSAQLESVGSRPQSITTAITYTSTTTSITFYWDGTNGSTPLTIYRDDGTTIGPFIGNFTVTGLSPNTTYFFYPFYQEAVTPSANFGQHPVGINWGTTPGGVGTPPVAFTAQNLVALQEQISRDHIPLATGFSVTGASTPASGSGSGSGGSGGGGGAGCFTGNVRIATPDGLKRFDELPSGVFEILNQTGVHRAVLVTHKDYMDLMVDLGQDQLVTAGHSFLFKGRWRPASQHFAHRPRIVGWRGTVYNLHILSEREEDLHYILENGEVAHNTINKF